ncbi:MmcQ/YjbR family DNA-binding protein [Pseudonocardia sp. GCM10023141]|uniref:MmcQ/YjbR family DNA-binding protein n=1 Tax=Pseudonocardia sp. GCM10023141 TaxID=3252653 RepID=UPI003606E909
MPVTAEDIRSVAAPLPRTEVAFVRDAMKFRVRGIVYAAVAPDELTMGFAFPKDERAALVAAQPAKFHLPIESDMRFNWVRAWLAPLGFDEMRELVLDAWQLVVPKKVVREYYGLRGRS